MFVSKITKWKVDNCRKMLLRYKLEVDGKIYFLGSRYEKQVLYLQPGQEFAIYDSFVEFSTVQ